MALPQVSERQWQRAHGGTVPQSRRKSKQTAQHAHTVSWKGGRRLPSRATRVLHISRNAGRALVQNVCTEGPLLWREGLLPTDSKPQEKVLISMTTGEQPSP